MRARGPCALCGENPAKGYAGIDDKWYCHGDWEPDPTCFMQVQWALHNWVPGEPPFGESMEKRQRGNP